MPSFINGIMKRTNVIRLQKPNKITYFILIFKGTNLNIQDTAILYTSMCGRQIH